VRRRRGLTLSEAWIDALQTGRIEGSLPTRGMTTPP
jgi:hypothetical protein